jgi:hypothetical protein
VVHLNKQQLNSLVVKSSQGCEQSYHELLRHYYPKVSDFIDRKWHYFNDEIRVIEKVMQRFERLISSYDERKGGNFDRQFWRDVQGYINAYAKRGEKRNKMLFYYQSTEDLAESDEDIKAFELEDVLADVEKTIIERLAVSEIKEKVAFLVRGDPKKEAILEEWMTGSYNDSELAARLSEQFSGTESGNRSTIIRLREKCKQSISNPKTA